MVSGGAPKRELVPPGRQWWVDRVLWHDGRSLTPGKLLLGALSLGDTHDCVMGIWFLCHRQKKSLTHNRKPQLGPQHRHHHDKVQKHGISYALGLMRSIAYRRICLVNRKTAIAAKMTLHVRIRLKQEAGDYVQYPFLVSLLGCVVLRLCVLW